MFELCFSVWFSSRLFEWVRSELAQGWKHILRGLRHFSITVYNHAKSMSLWLDLTWHLRIQLFLVNARDTHFDNAFILLTSSHLRNVQIFPQFRWQKKRLRLETLFEINSYCGLYWHTLAYSWNSPSRTKITRWRITISLRKFKRSTNSWLSWFAWSFRLPPRWVRLPGICVCQINFYMSCLFALQTG